MTDEERNAIFEQALRNISVERAEPTASCEAPEDDPLEMWERGMPKPEPTPPKRKLDTRQVRQDPNLYEWVEQRLLAEREFILEVAGKAIGEMLEEQHRTAKNALADEVRELKIELAELETTLCELRQVIAKERGLASSLPQSMRSVN